MLALETRRCWSGLWIAIEGRGKPFHNAAALLERGKPIRKTYKSLLPTYDVFDEDRYFEPATRVEPFEVQGRKSA